MSHDNTVRFHVWNLEKYNNDQLIGDWITLEPDMDEEEIQAAILKAIKGTPDDEWSLGDHENLGPFYSEHLGPSDLAEIAESLSECDRRGIDWSLFLKWCEHTGNDHDDYSDFEDQFVGFYDRFQDYAEEVFDDVYLPEVPDSVGAYIDYEAFARDLEMDYTVIPDGCLMSYQVAIFRNH